MNVLEPSERARELRKRCGSRPLFGHLPRARGATHVSAQNRSDSRPGLELDIGAIRALRGTVSRPDYRFDRRLNDSD
jgi:hypothetical protein